MSIINKDFIVTYDINLWEWYCFVAQKSNYDNGRGK